MITKLLFGTLGTLGFGMIFNVNKNKLLYITIGGLLNTYVYFITYKYTNNLFLSASFCAIITSIYSNIMANILKCPSTIFILTGLIPSVPGGTLFYTMQNLVLSNTDFANKFAIETVLVILGIVSGILISSAIIVIIKNVELTLKKGE